MLPISFCLKCKWHLLSSDNNAGQETCSICIKLRGDLGRVAKRHNTESNSKTAVELHVTFAPAKCGATMLQMLLSPKSSVNYFWFSLETSVAGPAHAGLICKIHTFLC